MAQPDTGRRPSVTPYGPHIKQGIRCRECHNVWPCRDRLLTDLAETSRLLATLQTSVQALFKSAGGDGYEQAVMDMRDAANEVTAWAKEWNAETADRGSSPTSQGVTE